MIKPTIGRELHYYPAPDEKMATVDPSQPFPAKLCFVHSDTRINISVFDHFGNGPYGKQEVLLVQDDDARIPIRPYACWMPYQKAVQAGAQAPTLHPGQDANKAAAILANAPMGAVKPSVEVRSGDGGGESAA